MNHGRCSLCRSMGCEWGEDRSRQNTVKYWCQAQYDTFWMSAVFLEYVWPGLSADDRSAIAVYLHATRGPQQAAPLIAGG